MKEIKQLIDSKIQPNNEATRWTVRYKKNLKRNLINKKWVRTSCPIKHPRIKLFNQ